MSLLQVKDCGIQFGGLKALHELDFELQSEELMGLIGPNGAGKTTFFNLLTGVYQPSFGKIIFDKTCLNELKPQQINRLGVARTFQNIRLFPELSVLDNVLCGFHQSIRYSLFDAVLSRASFREEESKLRNEAMALLERFHLKDAANELAKNLPYGSQRRLEMVRALATKPKLLLLDEPAAGMNSTEKADLISLIQRLHTELKLAILLIEHDMGVVMKLCPRILVLDYGVPIAEGTPEQIRANPKVIEAYLGERAPKH